MNDLSRANVMGLILQGIELHPQWGSRHPYFVICNSHRLNGFPVVVQGLNNKKSQKDAYVVKKEFRGVSSQYNTQKGTKTTVELASSKCN